MSRAAFVCNHRRTALFKLVSENLVRSGFEVCWISSGGKYLQKLLSDSDCILDISINKGALDKSVLDDIEKYSEITLSAIISSDRILSKKDFHTAKCYAVNIFSSVKAFLSENNVCVVFGEATWAHELVTASVCRSLGIPFLSPVNVRFPSDRFAFFKGINQSEYFRPPVPNVHFDGKSLLENFLEYGNSPFYMDSAKKVSLYNMYKHVIRHLTGDTRDLTVQSFYELASIKIKKFFSKIYPQSKLPDKPAGRYVFLPLQCSPESSLDVLGYRWSDRLDFVKNIAGRLPDGFVLAVKEHPLQISDRRLYDEMSKISNVVLLKKGADTRELIKGADCVVTVSGTPAYEAGLYGVKAAVFADMFFAELPSVNVCRSYKDFENLMKSDDIKGGREAAADFLSDLCACSFRGFAESADVYADAHSEKNIKDVSEAFINVLEYYSSKSVTAASI